MLLRTIGPMELMLSETVVAGASFYDGNGGMLYQTFSREGVGTIWVDGEGCLCFAAYAAGDAAPTDIPAEGVEVYSISLTYYINSSDSGSVATIQSEVAKAVDDFVTWQQSKIGRDINSSELIKRVTAAGAKRVEIKSPVFQKIGGTSIAYCTSKNVTYGGVEDD